MNRKRNASIVASTLFCFLIALAIPSVTFGLALPIQPEIIDLADGVWTRN